LPGVHFSSTAWGDYDNDGDLDILLTGFDGNNNPISKIYQNNRGGYTEVYVGSLTGVSYSSVAWGDYDNDSDLDILLTGLTSGGIAVSKIYKNNGVSINTAPAPPFGLSSTIIGSSVTLRWLKSTDTETPSSGLHYNIRLGTSSNAINTQSPMADVGNGFRRVVQLGNANQDTFWTIKNLSSGAYYWSVQAVDNAFTGSQFATEGNFMINANTTYHITTFFGINGTISPSGMVSIDSGANQIFSISPNSGYHIDSLIVDGVRVSSVPSYTFTNVTANHTIRAVFAINSYTITVASSANGTIFPGTSNVNYGDSVVYTISPNACYNVASVVIDGEVNAGAVSSYTFRNVTANHGITATFSTKQYTIVATAGENGSISPNGNVTVNCNGSQIFTVAPDPNYKIDSVIVDNGYSGRDSSYIFSNVKTNHFIRVSFRVINNYPVAVSLSDSIEKNRSKTITLIGEDPEGGRVTFFLDTQPMNGIIRDFNSSTGEVFYRTNHLFVGLDSFSFYCRDSLNAVSNIAWCIITVYAKSDSTTFRTFSQSDLKTAPVKKPKKGVRPMPTTGNVLDTLFVTGPFKKLKVKTDPKFPGGMVLGISQAVKDSAKKYGWIRHIGKSKDVQKSLTQFGSARGFDRFGNNRAFTKELKNPKTDNYSNQLAGELFALKVNIAASAKNITPSGFGNLVYDNPQQNPDTFVTKRLKIQGKTLAQISSEIDTLLTYYKRYYTGTTPSEEYSKITTAIIAVNEAFRSPIDTIGWSPLQLTSDVRIDGVEFLRRGSGGERLFRQREFTSSVPENILLLQNYPNPFNPATTLSFVISQSSSITLKIYDVLGQEVTMIIDNEVMDEGVYEVIFEAGDIPSGIYFTRLQAGTFLKTHKMILMK
ncbi:MAG: T9SS type A sorting domain-containing protein, partial [Ignavibacteriales bacterium]|nr:T9SS type A sorting domain-containing protein [Ignavibacteriales bacterium]